MDELKSELVDVRQLPYTATQLVVPEQWAERVFHGAFLTTMPAATQAERIVVFNTMNGESKWLDRMIGEPFLVEHVIVHSKPSVNEETGEETPSARVLLVAPDGSAVATGSPYILADINKLAGFFRALPWVPPMKVIARQRTSRKGRHPFYLELVEG